MSVNNQLDLNLLNGYLSKLGEATLIKMIALYRQQSNIYLQEIEQSVKTNDQTLWQQHCHKMKGAAGSVGLTDVHSYLVAIERSNVDPIAKQNLLSELQKKNKLAIDQFDIWLASKPSLIY